MDTLTYLAASSKPETFLHSAGFWSAVFWIGTALIVLGNLFDGSKNIAARIIAIIGYMIAWVFLFAILFFLGAIFGEIAVQFSQGM